ncbi:hypothetical protein EDD85DRAFT_929139 [Armillaria nabsnona]|nr:hypothetical protein EDD85DRAFT_929139 [Armillaria nabsnona]
MKTYRQRPSIFPRPHYLFVLNLGSFTTNAGSLFIQTVLAAPSRRATIFSILVVVRGVLSEKWDRHLPRSTLRATTWTIHGSRITPPGL